MEELFFKPIDPKITKGNHTASISDVAEQLQENSQYLLSLEQVGVDACIICGAIDQSESYDCRGFRWVKCPDCGHLYKSHMPAYDEVLRHMQQTTIEVYLHEKSIEYRLESITRPKYDFMRRYVTGSPGSWLDLASGLGDMPYLLKQEGWSVSSTEIHKPFVDFAKERLNVHHQSIPIDQFYEKHSADQNEPYDVVGAFGYFDMLPDPSAHAKIINRLLKVGGRIGVNIPICESLSGDLGLLWPDNSLRCLMPTDYSYFSKNSVLKMLENAGFEIEGIWWHGLDIHELITRMVECRPEFLGSKPFELLYKLSNKLQQVVDQDRKSDLLMICAKKIGVV